MEKLKIIVSGFIGLYPSGGVAWDYIQYPLGLKMLGHDVFYLEDTGQYPTYRITERPWDDPHDTVEYLSRTMERFGLQESWAYRDIFNGRCYGVSIQKLLHVCAKADIFINISASAIFREEYLRIPKRVLLDSDPMFTQVQPSEGKKDKDDRYVSNRIKITDYNYHFTFGENMGAANCKVPTLEINWKTTRQPVCLNYWEKDKRRNENTTRRSLTTIMNWSTRSKLRFGNEEWGQKDVEFRKFIGIPKLYKERSFEVVMAVSANFKREVNPVEITRQGWKVLDPSRTIATTNDYRTFISSSYAEFSVAKETYVKSNSGWFSGRSACYLASGRPVVTQNTEWSKYIPSGEGLFAFCDKETALSSLYELSRNYRKNSSAARELAREYFDSEKVLGAFIDKL